MSNKSKKPTAFNQDQFAAAKRVVLLTTFLDILGFGLIIPQLGIYAAEFGASATAVGWLMSSYSLMQFLFAPFWGRLSDRLGRRPLLVWSIFGTALSYILFAYSGNLWLLFASRIFSGITGANIAIAQAYLSDVTPAEDRAKTFGIFGAIFGVGFAVGPLIGGLMAMLPGAWGSNFGLGWLAAFLSFGNWILALRQLPETLSPEVRAANLQNQTDKRGTRGPINLHGLARINSIPNLRILILVGFVQMLAFATLQGTYTVFLISRYVRPQVQTEIRQNPERAAEQALKRQRHATTAPVVAGEGHSVTPALNEGVDTPYATALGGDFNPTDLPPPPQGLSWRRIEQLLVQPLAAKYVMGIFTTIGVLVLLVQGGMVGPLKKRFGEVNLIIYGTLTMAISLALVPIPTAFLWQFPVSALTAIGNSISAPVLTALISILAPESERGEIIGVFQSSQSLGRILGPLLGGVLFNSISYAAPYLAGAAIMIVAFMITLKLRHIEFHAPQVNPEPAPAES